MELIEIIKEIKELTRDIETDDEISKSALAQIRDLCENALIDYKVNKRLEQADKEFANAYNGDEMNLYPKTLEEAKKKRYNKWAGYPDGRQYKSGYCAYEVFSSIPSYQCNRKNGYGPSELYCKQHANKLQDLKKYQQEEK